MLSARQQRAIYDALVAKGEQNIADAFLQSAGSLDVSFSDLVAAIEAGDFLTIERLITPSTASLFPLAEAMRETFVGGGLSALRIGSGAFSFDGRSPRATAFIDRQGGDLIKQIQDDQRQAVRIVLQETQGEGAASIGRKIIGTVNPVTKRREGGIVGLTSQQTQWAFNAQRELEQLDAAYFQRKQRDLRFDRIVSKAIREGKPLSQADIDRITNRYRDKMLKARGLVIGATEANKAATAGQWEAFSQLQEQGTRVTKRWQHGFSREPRMDHVALGFAPARPFDQPFIMGDGTPLQYPHQEGAPAEHVINCRCSVIYRIVDAAAGQTSGPPPAPPVRAFRSPVRASVNDATIQVERRIDVQKRMTQQLQEAAQEPRYRNEITFSGRTANDYGRAAFSADWSDEAVSAVGAFKPELDDLADQIGIPRLRGFKTTRGKQNADMGGGVMALNPNEFNARAARIGNGGGAADLAQSARDESARLREQAAAIAEEFKATNAAVAESIRLKDWDEVQRVREIRAQIAKRHEATVRKYKKAQDAINRADRVASTSQTTWRPGNDLSGQPWSVAYYYSEGADRIRSTLFHEFAHHVHQQLNREGGNRPLERALRELWAQNKSQPGFAARLPSAYSKANQHEWFAESFSLFVMGKKDLADPRLVELIEGIFNGSF